MLSRRGFLKNMVLASAALAYGNAFGSKEGDLKTDALFPIRVNGRSGYIDIEGNMVIKPEFDFEHAGRFSEGLAEVQLGNTLCGYIGKTGNFVIPPTLRYASMFREGLAGVFLLNRDGHGFMDKTGKIVIEPRFSDSTYSFYEGLCGASINDKWGYIDRTGDWVIRPNFQRVEYFREGMARVRTDGKYGFINREGTFEIPPVYDYADFRFSEGLVGVKKDGKFMFIDKTGRVAIMSEEFEFAGRFVEGIANVRIKDKAGYINKDGQIIIKPKFDGGYHFSEGLAFVSISHKCGFINKNGDMVIELKYDYADPFFKDGLACVSEQVDNEWRRGYINKLGEYVWEPSA